ncbi:YcxB family protein [Paenibacillus sp. MMO-58]|uniref:YcxB family protein n=1 Tax=Paenibacillus sp. MMO-58 TaxID=3081290 RepID=UPI00301896F6
MVITCSALAAVTNSRLLAVIAAAVVVLALLNYVTQCIVHPRRIVKDRKLNGEFEYSFNSDNLELTVADGTSKANWSNFAKVWENVHYYFLFHNKRQYWIIPKESFRNAEQEQLFRQIVQSHHPIATGVIR